MKARDVERLLADQPAPPPPEGLAERIKNEVPDHLEVAPELLHDSRVVPLRRRRQWYIPAAAAVTAALAAAVTWQLREARLSTAPLETAAEAPRAEVEAEPASAWVRSDAEALSQVTDRDEASSTVDRDRAVALEPTDEIAESKDQPLPTGAADERGQRSAASREVTSGRQQQRVAAVADSLREDAATAPTEQDRFRGRPRPPEPVGTLRPQATGNEAGAPQIEEGGGRRMRELERAGKDRQGAAPPSPLDLRQVPKKEAAGTGAQVLVADTSSAGALSAAPSTGGTTEPNDAPYGDVFFREYGVNPFIDTEDDRLSTFGLDVDTGSYTVVRRYLRDGHLPPREAVRVEEILNFFDYGDRPPQRGDFELAAEGAPSPFAEGERYHVLRFAVTAREVAEEDRPPAQLVFVVDTSGSMARENRLGLVKKALDELLEHLRSDDRVGLVAYGSRGEVLLEPTADHEAIRAAIDRLHPAGSTNAEEGLVLAYRLAEEYLDEEWINRVILCSDGVANVGRTGPDRILERIERSAGLGIELTTVGFGMGNYNDVLMERLADTGDGRYAYVDSLSEARRIFVDELTGTLMTVAREAKAQVEFNPDVVSRYRLLGYENRDIADERFRDPTVDAGEIGAGHTVTVIYEIKLHREVGMGSNAAAVATLHVRYRRPGDPEPVELEHTIRVRDLARTWEAASRSLRLATLVAEYAEILKGAYWAKGGDLREVLERAQELSPEFAGDSRVADFVSLVATAADLNPQDDPDRRE